MKVMKFGGSSVANKENINKVIDIVLDAKSQSENIVVVVSALGGVTDDHIKMAALAGKGEIEYRSLFELIRERHTQIINDTVVDEKFKELGKIVKEIFLTRELSPRALDSIVSFGEQLSAYIISEVIRSRGVLCKFIDSREIIRTDDNFGEANVDIETSYKLISEELKNCPLCVMGGFIASTKDDVTTTLGRGGSDYTASLVGAALDASGIEIWTDVDGILTADPRKVKDAVLIPEISYEKAEEMAREGAKVIHPKTMKPARDKNIPIYIKNTFNPKAQGTKISNEK